VRKNIRVKVKVFTSGQIQNTRAVAEYYVKMARQNIVAEKE